MNWILCAGSEDKWGRGNEKGNVLWKVPTFLWLTPDETRWYLLQMVPNSVKKAHFLRKGSFSRFDSINAWSFHTQSASKNNISSSFSRIVTSSLPTITVSRCYPRCISANSSNRNPRLFLAKLNGKAVEVSFSSFKECLAFSSGFLALGIGRLFHVAW